MWSLPREKHRVLSWKYRMQMRSRLLSGTQRPEVVPLHTYVLITLFIC